MIFISQSLPRNQFTLRNFGYKEQIFMVPMSSLQADFTEIIMHTLFM